jgi:hypothetical protein
MKIRLVETEFFRVDGRTDMTKLIVAFHNIAKMPQNPCLHYFKNHTKHTFTSTHNKTNKMH